MADTNITARFFPNPVPQFFATDGTPAAGYKLFHFTTGTTEDKDIWTEEVDSSDTDSKHAQPIVLNSRGEVPGGMFGYGKYTFMLIPPTGPEDDYSDAIWTINDVDVLTIQDYIRDTLFACANAAAVRTALGLGDAAQLDDELNQAGHVIKWDNSGMYPVGDGTNITKIAHVSDAGVWDPTPPLPRSYLAGLKIERASATSVKVNIGSCRDVDDGDNIEISTAITKLTNAVFAEGAGAGGTYGGAASANTWYHVFVLKKSSDDTVDVVFSNSATLPTPPTGFDIKRRIGAFRTDATPEVITFTQRGDLFLWDGIKTDQADTISTSATTIQLDYVPDLIECDALLNIVCDTASSALDYSVYFYPSNMTGITPDDAPGSTANDSHPSPGFTFTAPSDAADYPIGGTLTMPMSSSRSFKGMASAASIDYAVFTIGWIDRRGRDD